MKSGSDIALTCMAVHSPAPPSFIYWYKDGRVINYSQRGGISVLTERKTRTSKLVISKAMSSDSGNYTCIPSSSGKSFLLFCVYCCCCCFIKCICAFTVLAVLYWLVRPYRSILQFKQFLGIRAFFCSLFLFVHHFVCLMLKPLLVRFGVFFLSVNIFECCTLHVLDCVITTMYFTIYRDILFKLHVVCFFVFHAYAF